MVRFSDDTIPIHIIWPIFYLWYSINFMQSVPAFQRSLHHFPYDYLRSTLQVSEFHCVLLTSRRFLSTARQYHRIRAQRCIHLCSRSDLRPRTQVDNRLRWHSFCFTFESKWNYFPLLKLSDRFLLIPVDKIRHKSVSVPVGRFFLSQWYSSRLWTWLTPCLTFSTDTLSCPVSLF